MRAAANLCSAVATRSTRGAASMGARRCGVCCQKEGSCVSEAALHSQLLCKLDKHLQQGECTRGNTGRIRQAQAYHPMLATGATFRFPCPPLLPLTSSRVALAMPQSSTVMCSLAAVMALNTSAQQ